MENLKILFSSETEGTVRIAWSVGEDKSKIQDRKRFADATLFACYALRQLNNLGRHPSSHALAENLSGWKPPDQVSNASNEPMKVLDAHVLLDAAFHTGVDFENAQRKYGSSVYLISASSSGGKGFVGRLRFTSQRPVFHLTKQGFGLGGILGFSLPQYATDSVFLFLGHLFQTYNSDSSFLDAISGVADDCSEAYHNQIISSLNQDSLALQYVVKHFNDKGIVQLV